MPCAGRTAIQRKGADQTIYAKNGELDARIPALIDVFRNRDGHRKSRLQPPSFPRLPDTSFLQFGGSDDHIEVAVVVHIEQAHPVVLAIGGAQRMAGQQVFIKPLLRFAEIEEHDLLPVFLDGIVDEFQELFGANPAVRMENEREGSLFDHDGVQCRLPIGDGPRVVRPVRIVRLPIARGHRGEFPAEPAYHVGIGIIFNRCAEPFQTEPGHLVGLRGKVLMKLFPAVPVEHQLARQGLVIGRGDVHYR